VATVTEAFAALAAGADGLKMFPAEALPATVLKAWRAVLPKNALVFPVGGIRPDNMQPFWVPARTVSERAPISTRPERT
jgi:2-dehydro-3-deoxyphosphogalactonate aldolase